MAKEIPSVGDLRRKSEVSDDEIEAATVTNLKYEGTARSAGLVRSVMPG